jgi:hypothetical protein
MLLEVQIKNSEILVLVFGKCLSFNSEEKNRQEFIYRLINYYWHKPNQLGQNVKIKSRRKLGVFIWHSVKKTITNSIPSPQIKWDFGRRGVVGKSVEKLCTKGNNGNGVTGLLGIFCNEEEIDKKTIKRYYFVLQYYGNII